MELQVVLNVGLCIALYDITNLQESFIIPGDGASHTQVTFRYIVFKPFIEEILMGKIRSCSQEGVHSNFKNYLFILLIVKVAFTVSLGFFDDIIIPPTALQHPSRFDETEQAWIWEYDTGDGSKHDLFMDAGETIRFRVTGEIFQETCPAGPSLAETTENSENKIPYMLYVGTFQFFARNTFLNVKVL